MLQSSVLLSRFSCDNHAEPGCHDSSRQRVGRLFLLDCMVLLLLSLVWTTQGVAETAPVGFMQDCSGFTQDPLLGHLSPGGSGVEAGAPFMSLAPMVPRLSLHGTALATYTTQVEPQAAPTLERVFGVIPGAQRQIVETVFHQEAQAVVLHPQVLATVDSKERRRKIPAPADPSRQPHHSLYGHTFTPSNVG